MSQRIVVLVPVLLSLCLTGGGCGGGEGNPPGGPATPSGPVTVVLPSVLVRDGGVRNVGTVYTCCSIFAGDLEGIGAGISEHGFVGFDITAIPPGATITTATLALLQQGYDGDPFGELGHVVVDHLDMGPGLDPGDYFGNTLALSFGTLSSSQSFGLRSLEVGAQVQVDVTAGRSFSDFRLRMTLEGNGDGGNDFALFEAGDNTPTDRPPKLTVTYVAP